MRPIDRMLILLLHAKHLVSFFVKVHGNSSVLLRAQRRLSIDIEHKIVAKSVKLSTSKAEHWIACGATPIADAS